MEPWQNNATVQFDVPHSMASSPPVTFFDVASPEYLRTFGVSMRIGRWFEATDNANAPPVIVVNESFANNYWPNGGAVGQCVRAGADTMPCRTIVGVLRDFHVSGQMDGPMYPTIIVPFAQSGGYLETPHLFVRVRGDRSAVMSSVRRALQTIEPNLPAVDVHPVESNASWFLASLKLGAAAFSAFGVLAAVIAALGLYSVLSLLIVEHRRMYAIRLALGGTPARLAGSLFRYTTGTVAIGLLIGGAVLLPVAKLIQPMLFHTNVLAPAALVGVAAMALLIAVGAAIGPARALLQTGVMSVLREQ
jgi:hypothetical protein